MLAARRGLFAARAVFCALAGFQTGGGMTEVRVNFGVLEDARRAIFLELDGVCQNERAERGGRTDCCTPA